MIYIYMTIGALLLASLYNTISNIETVSMSFFDRKLVLGSKEVIFTLLFLVLFVPGAIRENVGIDYTTYTNYQIPQVLSGNNNVKVEFLYKLVIRLGYWIGKGETYQYIFVLTNFLIILFILMYIQNQSENMVLSVFIFISGGFFAFSLSGMRQAIGVSIVLYSLKYINQRKMLKYFVFIFIASLFHSSALIFVVFYFFNKTKIKPFVVLIVMMIIFFFSNQIRNIIFSISSKLGIYSSYFGGSFDSGIYNKLLVLLVLVVMGLVCFTYIYVGKDSINDLEIEVNIHYIACIIVSMISVLPTPSRLLFLFIPVYITLIPNLIKKYKNAKIRFVLYLIIFLFLAYFMYKNIYIQDDYHILPYEDIFGFFK